MQVSHPVLSLKYSPIRAITDTARSIEGSILLTIGEPDRTPPQALVDEVMEYGKNNPMTYAPSGGGEPLRKLIAEYYNKNYGSSYTADNVVATVGASEGVASLFRVILHPGDEVLIPTPYFSAYPHYVEMAYGKAVICEASPSDDFAITPELLQKHLTPKTKALIFSNPSNPTGTVMSAAQVKTVAAFCAKHNITVIADEIYAAINFEGFSSFAALPETASNLVVVSGFSKSHSMTGWRLGYILCPKEMRTHFLNAHLYAVTCPATLALKMGELALQKFADSSALAQVYKERSTYLCNALRRIGFRVVEPKGAFYLFVNYEALSKQNSLDFAMAMLKETGVAMVPGAAFGCEGWLRAAVTQDMPVLKEAVERLTRYFSK